jgi:hypothetical protein
VWVGLKPTERLQASRGRRQGQRTRRTKALFEVNGEVRLKKRLTEPTLLEMSGRATSKIEALSRFDRVAFRTESLLSKDVMYDTAIADMWTI